MAKWAVPSFPGSVRAASDRIFARIYCLVNHLVAANLLQGESNWRRALRNSSFLFLFLLPPSVCSSFICRLLSFCLQTLFIRVRFSGPVFCSPQLEVEISRKVSTTLPYYNFIMLLRFDCELRQCKLDNDARYIIWDITVCHRVYRDIQIV